MTEEKRQKVMLGVLAVCVLGAGGIWVALHDWSGSASASTSRPTAQRRIRETAKQAAPVRAKRDRPKKAVKERRVRDTAERADPKKKASRKRRGKVKTEKKKIVPLS